jgi:hypothetical protein
MSDSVVMILAEVSVVLQQRKELTRELEQRIVEAITKFSKVVPVISCLIAKVEGEFCLMKMQYGQASTLLAQALQDSAGRVAIIHASCLLRLGDSSSLRKAKKMFEDMGVKWNRFDGLSASTSDHRIDETSHQVL